MKRRKFFGSLFAAGAIIRNPASIIFGDPAVLKSSGEMVTPLKKVLPLLRTDPVLVDRRMRNIKFGLDVITVKPKSIPTHIKVSSECFGSK